MDLNYNIDRECSLRTMSTATVVRCFLESSGLVPNFKKRLVDIASEASAKVDHVDLPPILNTDIKGLIKPIMLEMCEWFLRYNINNPPVLTVFGTLDLTKSMTALLRKSNEDGRYKRYQLCFQDYWLTYYHDPPQLVGDGNLSDMEYELRFMQAVYTHNFAAMQELFDWVPHDKMYSIACSLLEEDCVGGFRPPMEYPPSTYRLLFSRMQQNDQTELQTHFSKKLLTALLKWPYQHLFLKAAKTLVGHLSDDDYCEIAAKILLKALTGYEDHDYKELFVKFWTLCTGHKQGLNTFTSKDGDLMYLVNLMHDERLIKWVQGGVFAAHQPKLPMESRLSDIRKQLEDSKRLVKLEEFHHGQLLIERTLGD